jgi:hypothetical protein
MAEQVAQLHDRYDDDDYDYGGDDDDDAVKQQHTSTATVMMTTKSTYHSLSAQQLSNALYNKDERKEGQRKPNNEELHKLHSFFLR